MKRGLVCGFLWLALSGLIPLVAGCASPATRAGVMGAAPRGRVELSAAPTWTPTRTAATDRQQQTPTETAAVAIMARRATALPTGQARQFTPTLPAIDPAVTAPPTVITETKAAAEPRIDQAGPIAIPTVAALPAGEGRQPVRLLIPTLDLDVAIAPMGWHVVNDASGPRSEWDVVDSAAGHHVNSAYAGEAGNVVLSGHNNIGGAVFRTVCVVGQPGVDFGLGDDMILVDEAGRRFVYKVNGWRRTPERNASLARQEENARYMQPTDFPQLTLVTCWPPTSNTHRVVVTGLLVGREGG